MKTLILLSMFILVSCGTAGNPDGRTCRTLAEQRALCFVKEMDSLGHDANMTDWVINQCAIVYSTEGCYTQEPF